MCPVKSQAQTSFDDNVIEDPELEKMLDDREDLKEGQAAYRKLDKEVKEKLKGMTDQMPFRIGRYLVKCSVTEPREVEFTSSGGTRVNITNTAK